MPHQMKEVLQRTLEPGLQLLSLIQLRFACMIHVMYFACMRAEECLDLDTATINVFSNGNLQLTVTKSKTIQFCQLKQVFLIPVMESSACCLVRVLIAYYNALHEAGGSKYLFPNFITNRTVIPDSKMSYNNVRSLWVQHLQKYQLPDTDKTKIGLHSLRISSAINASFDCGKLDIQRLC